MIQEINFNDKVILSEIDTFLASMNSEYTQSIAWNKVRNEKVKYFLYYIDSNKKIVWTCNLLEKEKEGEKYLYAPRGPVLDYNDKDTLELFFDSISLWMTERGYFKLVINPILSFENLSSFPKKYPYQLIDSTDYAHLHDSCKLAIMDIVFDEEELIKLLPSKFRQNTRRSYRKDLTFKISKNIDYENFYKLYIETSIRHDFQPHTLEYFQQIYKQFSRQLIFLEVWYHDIPLAMSIDLVYHGKLIYLYGVSSSNHRNMLGMYQLQWEDIKYCISNHISQYDFGGVFCQENDYENKDYGLYHFKRGYCYRGFIDIVPDIVFNFNKEVKEND